MTEKASEKKLWDVIIVGGGMVGATVALGLAKNDFDVLLIEKKIPDVSWSDSQMYQPRVSALTRASENILRHLGAWQGIEKRRFHAFTDMHVWEDISESDIHFAASELNEPNLGLVVENNVIQAALWEQFDCCDNLHLLSEKNIQTINLEQNQAVIFLEDGTELKARLLVGADGAHSNIRKLVNIGLDTHDYEQCAIVGCVKTEFSNQDTCWQRYREEGPFAYLAMENHISSIAWYLPTEKMEWALSLDDQAFAEEVRKASGDKLGMILEVYERSAFPLVRRHAEEYVKPHLALVGDAAHTIHPQAGQGVNLGLLDAAALIEVLVDAKGESKHWDRLSVLRRYQRWRKGDNAVVQRSMEGFDWLFAQNISFKNEVRKWFLPLADKASPIKGWLIKQTLNGRNPRPELTK